MNQQKKSINGFQILKKPHPHVDPTFPDGITADTNPPVFVWKPKIIQGPYALQLYDSRRKTVLKQEGLTEPIFLPHKNLPPGSYSWKWSREGESRNGSFTVPEDAVTLEVPPAEELLKAFPAEHPRIFLDSGKVPEIRKEFKANPSSRWKACVRYAREILAKDGSDNGFSGLRLPGHKMKEPPSLPDRNLDYSSFFSVWYPIMWDSRLFVYQAKVMAAAYLATREEEFARAACSRMASVCGWDPKGSTSVFVNDEAHMSVIWHGSVCCDWMWEEFSPAERETVIQGLTGRGEETYRLLTQKGIYGLEKFDSHSGREIVFLAFLAVLLRDKVPAAHEWFRLLRPILCGIWPVWGEPDGSWAEGHSYARPYVAIMSMFATALKKGTGVNLYRRPFWRNHLKWHMDCYAPYTDWGGFGDTNYVNKRNLETVSDLLELISRQTESYEGIADYLAELKEAADKAPETTPERRDYPSGAKMQLLFLSQKPLPDIKREKNHLLSVYPGAGHAAIRTSGPAIHDRIDFFFRSSPYGSVSHSHANNNDFVLLSGGNPLLAPSGFYCGYGSPHHAHWVWHTKSHNCVTLSDDGQLTRNHYSRGALNGAYEDEELTYFLGIADESYRLRAEELRRHVIFHKGTGSFILIDTFTAGAGILSSLQWNAHSPLPFQINPKEKSFFAADDYAGLRGFFLYQAESFFTLTDNWEPAPEKGTKIMPYPPQYNLRFTPATYSQRRAVGIILIPSGIVKPEIKITTDRSKGIETGIIEKAEEKAVVHIDPEYPPGGHFMSVTCRGKNYYLGPEGIEQITSR
jgi:hypothetical protein